MHTLVRMGHRMVLLVWEQRAHVSIHHYSSLQGYPRQYLAVKRSKDGGTRKSRHKRSLLRLTWAFLWPPKGVIEPDPCVQKLLHSAPRYLFIMYADSNAHGPFHKHPRHPKRLKKWQVLVVLIDFQLYISHLQHPFLATIVNFLLVLVLHTHTYHSP